MPEQITAEEMKAGTQPTRMEKLMFTPVEEVLAKDAWDDIDVEILVANRHALPADVLERLGITTPAPLTEAEVMAQNAELMKNVPPEVVPDATDATETVTEPVETVIETVETEPETATATVDNDTTTQE